MTLLQTKPTWCPTAIATDRGWMNPSTGEILVSHKNLKSKLAAEQAITVQEVITPEPAPQEVIEIKPEVKEVIMQETPTEVVKEKRVYNKKPKVITEVVEQKKDVQIIGEVVEYDLQKTKVIGE
jgi:hypothetical protein